MLWSPGQGLTDKRYDRLTQMVKECVSGLGAWRRPVQSLVPVPLVRWYAPITFFKRDLDRSQGELSDLVLEKVEVAVGRARLDLYDRGADSELGFWVLDAMDITGEPGWEAPMGDIAVYLEWRGPKPSFWPHKLRQEDVEREKIEDNAGMTRDYSDIVGKPWGEFMDDVKRAKNG